MMQHQQTLLQRTRGVRRAGSAGCASGNDWLQTRSPCKPAQRAWQQLPASTCRFVLSEATRPAYAGVTSSFNTVQHSAGDSCAAIANHVLRPEHDCMLHATCFHLLPRSAARSNAGLMCVHTGCACATSCIESACPASARTCLPAQLT